VTAPQLNAIGLVSSDLDRTVAFYRALAFRCSVGDALDHAKATLAAKNLPDEHAPRCRTRPMVDAHQMFL